VAEARSLVGAAPVSARNPRSEGTAQQTLQDALVERGLAEVQTGGGTSNFPANTVMAQRYEGLSGQVLSASAYLGSSASGSMRIGLYADNAGELGALIATAAAKAFTATSSGHWEELTSTAPPMTVGASSIGSPATPT
jgi:hypothetical protein